MSVLKIPSECFNRRKGTISGLNTIKEYDKTKIQILFEWIKEQEFATIT